MQDKQQGGNPLSDGLYYHTSPSDIAQVCEKIGVIIPNAMNPAYPDMAYNIKRTAQSSGLRALVCNAQNSLSRETACLSALLEANVTGIIAMPVNDQSHDLYVESSSPVVVYGCRTPEETLGNLAMDDELAGRLAAKHLLARGHRKLAFLADAEQPYFVKDRLNGFAAIVQESGAELTIANVEGCSLRDSYFAMLSLLNEDSPPTAIAAMDDYTAIGAWQALRDNNIPVGDGVALLGFGNTPFAMLPKHGLSSVGPVGEDQAGAAIALLHAMQSGVCGMRSRMLLTPHLVCRSTFHD